MLRAALSWVANGDPVPLELDDMGVDMSDTGLCPKCGRINRIVLGPWYLDDYCQCPPSNEIKTLKVGRRNWDAMISEREQMQSEIARLKAELKDRQELLAYAMAEGDRLKAAIEQAEIERNKYKCSVSPLWTSYRSLMHSYKYALEQRDEARRWARKLYAENASLRLQLEIEKDYE